MRKMILTLLSMLICATGFTQVEREASAVVLKERQRAIYLELGGASNYYGLSYDSRFKPNSRFGYRVGISYCESSSIFTGVSRTFGVPLEVNYLLGSRKNKLELGLGSNLGSYSVFDGATTSVDENEDSIHITYISKYRKIFGYFMYANIGYRFVGRRGFLFRAGINPSFSFNGKHAVSRDPAVWPYLSFGYAF
jgi:hypothetical protein